MKRLFSVSFVLLTCLSAVAQPISILIDPGHGGKDPGHLPENGNGLEEKVLALDIALKVGNYLSENLSNVNVGYTRTDDSYPTLDERVDQANSGDYDFMLSVHINGNPKQDVYGTETLIHDYDAKDSYKWAKLVEYQFKKRAGRKSRGVKTKQDLGHSLQILKFTKIPTIIVECGFITNGSEAYYLTTVYGQEIIASAIFRATREFIQFKHPTIDFRPAPKDLPTPEEETDDEKVSAHYSVQIMASIDPIELDIPQFKELNYPVERLKVETTSLYKYKYYVGNFESKKEARPVQKDMRENGFKDAFITYVE
jgi:N-acetylmuramoyl-L-alanine amidase